jgi:hypothetical protein
MRRGKTFTHKVEGVKVWTNLSRFPTLKADIRLAWERLQVESWDDFDIEFKRMHTNSYSWALLHSDLIVLDIEKLVQEYQAQLTDPVTT